MSDRAERPHAEQQAPGEVPAGARAESAGSAPYSSDATVTQPAAEDQPAAENVQDTHALLREALNKAREHEEAWLRALADTDNVRKRAQTEIANAHKYAVENLASQLLPVKDSLEAALAAENATLEAVRSGVELTLKQLAAVFDKSNLNEINPEGQKFDPHRHQAISMLPSDREPNTVINVLQKGYLLHDRVIRPALVTVAKAKDA